MKRADPFARTTEGGFIIAGRRSAHVYLIKISGDGNTLWERIYDEFEGYANAVQQTSDDGYVLTGSVLNPDYQASYGLLVLKLDKNGDIIWKINSFPGFAISGGHSIIKSADGGYIVTGRYNWFAIGGGSQYFPGILLRKLSSSGEWLWNDTSLEIHDLNCDGVNSIRRTPDGEYVLTGQPYSSSDIGLYLAKITDEGDISWERSYGKTNNDTGNSVWVTSDGGYIVAGATYISGSGDVYLVKTDDQGELLWEKIYGGSEDDVGMSVLQAADGGYMIAGYTNSFGVGESDIYLIKTDGNGNVQ